MKRIAFTVLFGFVFLSIPMAWPATAEDLVGFPEGTSAHVARDDRTRAMFALELSASVRAQDLQVRRISVRQDDIPASDLFDAVTVKLRPRLQAVMVVLDDPTPEAGEYEVSALLRQGARRQVVTFTLIRDPADVRAPASVEVEHRSGESDESVRIRIGPHDSVAKADLRVAETDTTQGSVCGTFSDDDDGVVSLSLRPDGVELGESQHTCEITSPLLADPLEIVVSVRSSRTLAWIFWLVVLGVAAGFGVRSFLSPRLAMIGAELRLARIRVSITRALEGMDSADARLPGLAGALRIVDSVPDGADVEAIDKASKDAADAYSQAMRATAAGPVARRAPAGRAVQAVRQEGALQAQRFILEAIRAVLLTIVLVLVAFGLFADTWVGTWQQMATVLSWAFALDVTTSAVQQQIGKVTPTKA